MFAIFALSLLHIISNRHFEWLQAIHNKVNQVAPLGEDSLQVLCPVRRARRLRHLPQALPRDAQGQCFCLRRLFRNCVRINLNVKKLISSTQFI